eukprot:gene7898-10720_t
MNIETVSALLEDTIQLAIEDESKPTGKFETFLQFVKDMLPLEVLESLEIINGGESFLIDIWEERLQPVVLKKLDEDEILDDGYCLVCERMVNLTKHHLYPRETHKRLIKKGIADEVDINVTISICRMCHNAVHRFFSNDELADKYHSLESLLEDAKFMNYAKWASKQSYNKNKNRLRNVLKFKENLQISIRIGALNFNQNPDKRKTIELKDACVKHVRVGSARPPLVKQSNGNIFSRWTNSNKNNNQKSGEKTFNKRQKSSYRQLSNEGFSGSDRDGRVSNRNEIIAESLITNIISLGFTYLTIKMVSGSVKSAVRGVGKLIPDDLGIVGNLTHFLKPNTTLSDDEIEILNTAVVNPIDIESSFAEIGGQSHVKLSLMEFADTIIMNKAMNSSIEQPPEKVGDFLLYGPPGCGKSVLVRSLCKECGVPLISVVPSLLLRKYYGETPALTSALFSLSQKLEPCVMFVDEMDSLLRGRSDFESASDRNLKIEFMQLWDKLLRSQSQVIVVGATNRPQDLDPAIQRRFDRSFLVGLPNEEERIDIFKTILRKEKLDVRFDWMHCAKITASYTPNDIQTLCKAAIQIPKHEMAKKIKQPKKTLSNTNKHESRTLRTSDFDKAILTTIPTAWSAKAFENNSNGGNGGGPSGLPGGNNRSNPTDKKMDNYSADDDADENEDDYDD